MEKAKLAIIFWDLGIGGVGTRILDIYHRTAIQTKIPAKLFLKRKVPSKCHFPIAARYFSKQPFLANQFIFLIWLLGSLCFWKPSHVLAFFNRFGLVAVIYKLLCGLLGKNIRVIVNQSVLTSHYLRQYESWYWKYVTKWLFRLADVVIVNSKAIKVDLQTNFGVPQTKIVHIPSWIATKDMKLSTPKKYDAIFVGRLSPEKGIDTLLETAEECSRRLKKFKLLVVGDGALKNWMMREITKRKLRETIEYVGYKSSPTDYMKQAKVLLLPSRNEGLPMVVLEAAAWGVPAIVTPFLGADEAVEDGKTGLIVKRKNYARKVAELLQDLKKLKGLGKNAQYKARTDFSLKNLDRFVDEIFMDNAT